MSDVKVESVGEWTVRGMVSGLHKVVLPGGCLERLAWLARWLKHRLALPITSCLD